MKMSTPWTFHVLQLDVERHKVLQNHCICWTYSDKPSERPCSYGWWKSNIPTFGRCHVFLFDPVSLKVGSPSITLEIVLVKLAVWRQWLHKSRRTDKFWNVPNVGIFVLMPLVSFPANFDNTTRKSRRTDKFWNFPNVGIFVLRPLVSFPAYFDKLTHKIMSMAYAIGLGIWFVRFTHTTMNIIEQIGVL